MILIVLPYRSFGLSFLGQPWSEANLIGYAYAFEQRTQVRNKVQPYLVPTTELVNVVASSPPNVSFSTKSRRFARY